jgi:hypothetical protein
MSSYTEGTKMGLLKIRDLERAGQCIMQMQTQFTEKVCMIHYNREKNVLFAASKDGRFHIWKVPHEWRAKWVDKLEREAEIERR